METNDVENLLVELDRRGARIERAGNRLFVRPNGVLDDRLRHEISANKQAIMEHLAAPATLANLFGQIPSQDLETWMAPHHVVDFILSTLCDRPVARIAVARLLALGRWDARIRRCLRRQEIARN